MKNAEHLKLYHTTNLTLTLFMKKLLLLVCALAAGIAAQATDYYLIGGFNNWTLKAANCLFTAASDGTYVLDYDGILTSGFKINDGTWSNDAANFGSNGSALQLGQPYTMTVGGTSSDIKITENIANPHLVLNVADPANPVLTITGQSQEAEYKYGIKGQIFDGKNWNVVDMVENEDNGKWALTAEVVAGEFGVMVMDASTSAQAAWFSADGDGVLGTAQLGQPLALKENGTNFASTLAGTFTFVFDPNAMTLTVSGEGSDEPEPVVEVPENLYIVGNIAGCVWQTATAPALTKNGNTFTIESVEIVSASEEISEGFFSFITVRGADWDSEVNTGDRFGASQADEVIEAPATVTLTAYKAGVNASAAASWMIEAAVYNITVDFATMTVEVVKVGDGVNSIEINNNVPAVYYNLQGVEVAEPANGLFIEVRGNQVRKVTLK